MKGPLQWKRAHQALPRSPGSRRRTRSGCARCDGLANPKIKTRLANLGGTVLAGSPTDFGKLIADETEKWAKVIRAANIKAE